MDQPDTRKRLDNHGWGGENIIGQNRVPRSEEFFMDVIGEMRPQHEEGGAKPGAKKDRGAYDVKGFYY